MLRLLLVTDFFEPEPGGLEFFFNSIAVHWKADEIEVIVTRPLKNCIYSKAEQKAYEKKNKFSIFYMDFYKHKEFTLSLKRKNKHVLEFYKKRLGLFKPDCVVFSSISFLHFSMAYITKKENIPYLLFLQPENLLNSFSHFHIFNRYLARHSLFYLTPSKYVSNLGISQGLAQEKMKVIPPFIGKKWKTQKPPAKKNSKEIEKIIKNSHSPQLFEHILNKKILLSVGPLLARKGLDKAILVFSKLLKENENLHYIIVGSGPEFYFLKEYSNLLNLEKNITFTGLISEELLQTLYRISDIFIQPGSIENNDVEALGTVFMEAAWWGLPIIAGDVGGVGEVVKHNVTGLLHSHKDNLSMYEHIIKLLTDTSTYTKIRTSAKKFAKEKFSKIPLESIEKIAKQSLH